MKSLISITNFYPTTSSIEFVINSIIYLNQDNIFLYYNNKRLNNSDYEFITNTTNTTTNCIIRPYTPFNENGYITLFIETETYFSNTIFSYFSFNTLINANNELFTTLTAHIPEKTETSNYKLSTFTPYELINSYPAIFSIIHDIDSTKSTVSVDASHEDYNIYTLVLMSNTSTPLPNNNYIVKFYFEGDGTTI